MQADPATKVALANSLRPQTRPEQDIVTLGARAGEFKRRAGAAGAVFL